MDLAALDLRTYIGEPDRGRRTWTNKAAARTRCMRITGASGAAGAGLAAARTKRRNGRCASLPDGRPAPPRLRGHGNISKSAVRPRRRLQLGTFHAAPLRHRRTSQPAGAPGDPGPPRALWTHIMDLWRARRTPSAIARLASRRIIVWNIYRQHVRRSPLTTGLPTMRREVKTGPA